MVETQLCKLRDTSDTLIGRACAVLQLKYGVCEIHIYDMAVDTYSSSTSFMVGRSRVFHILLHERFRSVNPYVLPGWTGRFYKGDAVHNHSAHAYHIIRIEEGAIYA